MVDDIRRGNAEVPAHGESSEGVVARRVERLIVVEKLDDDVLGAEPVNEPIELPGRHDGTGLHERCWHCSFAAARQDEQVAPSQLGQPVEVVARPAFLTTGEIALADGTGKTGVALRVAGENDQVGPGRVRSAGTRAAAGATALLVRSGTRLARVSSAPKTVGTPTSFAASAKRTTP